MNLIFRNERIIPMEMISVLKTGGKICFLMDTRWNFKEKLNVEKHKSTWWRKRTKMKNQMIKFTNIFFNTATKSKHLLKTHHQWRRMPVTSSTREFLFSSLNWLLFKIECFYFSNAFIYIYIHIYILRLKLQDS